MAAPIYLPTNNAGEFPLLHTLSSYCYRHLDDDHFDWYEVIPHCSFELHFLIVSNVEHFFICLLAICVFFEGNTYLGLVTPFFFFWGGVKLFALIELYELCDVLDINPLSLKLFANIFSHFVGCLFIFFDSFFCCS